jgi:hypothetical protein
MYLCLGVKNTLITFFILLFYSYGWLIINGLFKITKMALLNLALLFNFSTLSTQKIILAINIPFFIVC